MAASLTQKEPSNWEAAYEQFGGKVRTFARKSWREIPGFDLEDMEQELLTVLAECVIHYDPNKGARFNTFFQRSVVNRIVSLKRMVNTKSRKATLVYLEEDAVRLAVERLTSASDPEEIALDRIMIQEILDDLEVSEVGAGKRAAA